MLEPRWYNNDLTPAKDVLLLDSEPEITCCNGYGIARYGEAPRPNITYGTARSTIAPTLTTIDSLISDPTSTTCVLDDGTIAYAQWISYETSDCDGSNPQEHWYVFRWWFKGSDNVLRSVVNTYQGFPPNLTQGANTWVPFEWINPERNVTIYKIEDGTFAGIIQQDMDIQSMRCNFFDSTINEFTGADITVENGTLEQSFEQTYKYPYDDEALCDPNIVQDQCIIFKTINNYRLIQTESTDGLDPFMRYNLTQVYDTSPKIAQRGILTNTKYIGKYEILNEANTTGSYSDISQLEQETRKDTQFGGEGSYGLIVNDREHIAKFDRIRGLSTNYFSNTDLVMDLKMPTEDQTRSVFSQNGYVMILDKDLGIIKINQWRQSDAL